MINFHNSLSIPNCKIFCFDSIDSTNTEAKRYISRVSDFTPALFIANSQTAGRGRIGRSFFCRKGCGIYMSLLYFSSAPICDIVSITTSAAVAVAVSIEKLVGREMKIKWVNDVYSSDGKVCGILVETQKLDEVTAVIVGIGINTGNCDFPPELKNIASSIGDISGKEASLVDDIVKKLLIQAQAPLDRSYMTEYRKRFAWLGADVDLLSNGETVASGKVLGIDDDGGLIFLPHGEAQAKTVTSGEISLKLNSQ